MNYYTRNVMRHAPGIGLLGSEQVSPAGEETTMGREVYPDGLRALVNRVHRDYAFPDYYITEHGAALPRRRGDGRRGPPRPPHRMFARPLRRGGPSPARARAVAGLLHLVPDGQYQVGHGYAQRFGLVYIDQATQAPLWKDSAHWDQQFLRGP